MNIFSFLELIFPSVFLASSNTLLSTLYFVSTVYSAKESYRARLDARDMLEQAIENEADNMYEDWEDYIWADIERGDIKDIQLILDDIMSRDPQGNITYEVDEELELDLQNCEIKREG